MMVIECILYVRILVLALGEVAQPSWWRTRYLSGTGLRFLERLYPRTAFSAAVRATGIAACAVHDGSIGRGHIFHLFRLPNTLEREIHILLSDEFGKRIANELRTELENAERLKTRLQRLVVNVPEVTVGPLRFGKSTDLRQPELYARMAGAYLQAFQRNEKIFPYVETEEKEQ